jgi:Helix-turn-helix domain
MNDLTTREIAFLLQVPYTTAMTWITSGLFEAAYQEQTPRGPIWRVPRASLATFKKPQRGRPRRQAA